ncbi:hypothetical protein ACH5RR_008526 [Cinchona calisaya]|uniref:Uncharacterized protein n=1 Tax=Cinchona calisaya TaxID=153742 RepID=A0ABD3ADD4_9GENT
MSQNDDEDEEELSGRDTDDGFDEDMEALRRACLLTGTNLDDSENPCSSSAAAADTTTVGAAAVAITTAGSDSEADDAEDDLELVRNIQKRFAIVTDDVVAPLTLKPLCSIPPGGEEEDDFNDDFDTLRAIQRRFSAYNGDGLGESTEIFSHRPENSNAEEFLNHQDKIDNATQNIEACSKVNAGTQPSDFPEWHNSDSTILPIKGSSFPKAAEAFVDAIKKNRSCQKLLRSKLMHTEARMEELKKLKERVKILKDFQLTCRRRTGQALSQKKDARVQLISASKLSANVQLNEKKSSPMQYGPAENSQVANYRDALKKFPVFVTRNKWSKEEQENLANGVKQQFQKMLLQRSVDLLSDVDGSFEDFGNLDIIAASIRDLDITPEKMRQFLPKVNWDELASMYLPGRSGAECQARWLNCEDPLINQNSWSSMEDKNLLHVVQQKGLSNWIDIAVSMGTNRTPFQCLARYQRSLNASIIKRDWTEDEDNQLRAAVEAFGESNWQLVASTIEGRTGTQCSNRWMKTLHPARQRVGKWTPEEDKRLKVAVMLFGPKTWKKISQFVPGRTQVQCRERWVNCLDPSLNLDEWTLEEDSKLKAAIEEHGYCWSKVAACVPPRTDSQCRRRWKVLLPHEVPLLQAARKMQRTALISNFVDRESERPALRPSDFVPLQEITSISEHENVNLSEQQHRGLSDLCSKEVPASGIEVESFTCDSISRRKRQKKQPGRTTHKRQSRRTKSNPPSEEPLCCCPDTMQSSATTKNEELKTSGGVNHCQNISTLKSKSTGSGHDSTSKRRSRKQCPKKDGGSGNTNCQVSSSSGLNLLMLTGGDELSELFIDDESATQCKQMLDQHPSHSSCNELREENGACKDSECHLLSYANPNLSMIANGEEAGEVGRNDGADALHRKASKLHPRWPGQNAPPVHIPGLSISNIGASDVVGDSVVNKQRRETTMTSVKDKSIDAADQHLSSSLYLTMENNLSASGVSGMNGLKRSRNRGETSSNLMVVAEETGDDGMTLAAFCNKTLAASEMGDDDATLASFCNKFKRRKKKG